MYAVLSHAAADRKTNLIVQYDEDGAGERVGEATDDGGGGGRRRKQGWKIVRGPRWMCGGAPRYGSSLCAGG